MNMTTRPCPNHPDRTSPQHVPRHHRYEVRNDPATGAMELRCVWCGAVYNPALGG